MRNIKNFKSYKKLLALLNAGIMTLTPAISSATELDEEYSYFDINQESNVNSNMTSADLIKSLGLVQQEVRTLNITVEKFAEDTKMICNYLRGFFDYPELQRDVQSTYFIVNSEFISCDVEKTLVEGGVIKPNGSIDFACQRGIENLIQAISLGNLRGDYNKSLIHHDYIDKKMDINRYVDLSIFCADEHDKELVHNMFVNWFNAYKNGRFPNKDQELLFKQLTTLNAVEGMGNAYELSYGARFLALSCLGQDFEQMLRDDMQDDYTRDELNKYFDTYELNRMQWVIRDDVSIDLNCPSELELEVATYGTVQKFREDSTLELAARFNMRYQEEKTNCK